MYKLVNIHLSCYLSGYSGLLGAREGGGLIDLWNVFFSFAMGLKGLFTVLRDYHSLWSKIQSIDDLPAKLVVDGRTIANSIYSECKFDGLCGGQYTDFFEKVFRLFVNLRNFGFEILILMECGKHESSESDIFDRRMTRWLQFKKSLREGEPYTRMPILGYHVFIKVARILNIEVIPIDIETSTALVGVAKLLNAYILTNRNESFICDIPGVISLNNITWEADYLEGKVYSFERFHNFTSLSSGYLPLLFLLSSPETYITCQYCIQEVNHALSHITRHSIPEGEKLYFRRRFDRALKYLRSHMRDTHMAAYSRLKSQMDERFHQKLDDSLDTASTKLFQPDKLAGLDASKPFFGMNYSSTLDGEQSIAFEVLFRLDYVFWGALGLNDQCVFISSRGENFQEDAAGLISKHIRCVIYGIMCPQKEFIKEHLRSKEPISHRIEKVSPITTYKGRVTPSHASLGELSEKDKIDFLFHCLDFDITTLSDLPEFWYLPVVSVHYWLVQREGNVPVQTARLLLLCFLACSNGEDHNIDLVPKDSALAVINENIKTVHHIAEWQYVVSDIVSLKGLLGIESLILTPERLYNGRFFFSLLICQQFAERVTGHLMENKKIVRIYEQMSELALSPIVNRKPTL